jgi:hypothetical protein
MTRRSSAARPLRLDVNIERSRLKRGKVRAN